ncbi:MAG: aldo/keto reductase [Spirochaetia bacterium]
MDTLTLGKSDLSVSRLCLGTMFFGSKESEDISFRLLDRYMEAGGNFLDTANIYARFIEGCSGGESENVLGRWMKDRGARDRMIVASKVGFDYPGVERGLSAQQITGECEKSLQRLGIDCIDLYYAHCDDRLTPLDETLEAYDRLVTAGKVRSIGASNYTAWRLKAALEKSKEIGVPSYICIQQRYTYLRPRPGTSFNPQLSASEELLDLCRSEHIPLLPYSPLLGGAYARTDKQFAEQYRGADSNARLGELQTVASELEVSPNQVVIAWMLHHDFPVVPLIAASSLEQLEENLAAEKLRLSDEQLRRLNDAGEKPE